MIRIFATIALSAFVLPAAHADSLGCKFKGENGASADVSFTRAADGTVSASLNVNGEAVPAVGACRRWAHGNPLGMHLQNGEPISSGVRCPFGKDSMRIELYPTFGDNAGVKAVQWDGNELVGMIESKDCK